MMDFNNISIRGAPHGKEQGTLHVALYYHDQMVLGLFYGHITSLCIGKA